MISYKPHTRCHGFTLLELMVVLVLMGIILSMVTISVGDGGKYRQLEEESQRLKTLISMAKEEVVMRSKTWRIAFTENGYQFEEEQAPLVKPEVDEAAKNPSEEDEGTKKPQWVPINNKIFRPRELAGYRLSVTIEDEEYTPAVTEEEEAVAEDIIGYAYIYYSGEMMPFELTIEQEEGEDKFTLKADPFGELELTSSRDQEV